MVAPALPAPPIPAVNGTPESNGAVADAEDSGARTRDWVDVIRRTRLALTVKLVAHTIASHANPDGTKVYPGLARLVYETGIGYSTARRAVADLRAAGLLELVRRGNRRMRQADEYRLVLAPDLLDKVDVPSPEEARRQIESINARVTGSGRERQRRISAHVDSVKPVSRNPAEVVDNPPDGDQHDSLLALTQVSDETRSNAQIGGLLALTQESAHLVIEHHPRTRDRPSRLAGNHQRPSTARARAPQSPLLAVIDGDLPDHPVDDYQLALSMPLEPPVLDPDREAQWPALAEQLTRINQGTAS